MNVFILELFNCLIVWVNFGAKQVKRELKGDRKHGGHRAAACLAPSAEPS